MLARTRGISAFFSRHTFRIEMLGVIFLKIIGLIFLYHFFFSHPTDHALNTDQLREHYLIDNK